MKAALEQQLGTGDKGTGRGSCRRDRTVAGNENPRQELQEHSQQHQATSTELGFSQGDSQGAAQGAFQGQENTGRDPLPNCQPLVSKEDQLDILLQAHGSRGGASASRQPGK